MSGDPEQEYFADGMVEEIITALSRIRWLFVIARNSSFTNKGQGDRCKAGRAGTRCLVCAGRLSPESGPTGAYRRSANRRFYRHTSLGGPLRRSLENVFELQDMVVSSVAGVIEPTLQAAEIGRSAARPTSDLTACHLYLRALQHWSAYEKERVVQALDLLRRAIERDPHYGARPSLGCPLPSPARSERLDR
jgi:hypothetical protein